MKKHLLQAAERGDAEAQFNLGIMYENGLDDSRYAVEGQPPGGDAVAAGRRRTGLAPRADQTRRNLRRRARDTGELGKGLRVVPVGDDEPAWRPSPEGSVRLPARLLPLDAVSNRRGRAFRARLEAKGAHHGGNVGSAGNARGRTSVIRGRSANCHSDPDRPGLGGIHHASSVPLSSPGKEAASLDATIDEVTVIADGADDSALARDMIEVHGAITEAPVPRAATILTKRVPKVLQPKRRCRSALRIIKAATRRGTPKPVRSPSVPVVPAPIAAAGERRHAFPRIFCGQHPQPAHTHRAQRQATARPDPPPGFDWFVTGQVVPVNPAGSVRVPRHVVDRFGL